MSAIPTRGKLLWKLMLKEQDSSTEAVWTPAAKSLPPLPTATSLGQGLTPSAPHTAQLSSESQR